MKPDNHIFIPEKKIGVLMVNLGTPDNTDYVSMWLYLREFLSDRRIIELTRFLWFPILFLIILIIRPKKSGRLYEKIWDKKRNKSPLKVFSESVAEKLQKQFVALNSVTKHISLSQQIGISKDFIFGVASIEQTF